MTPDAGVQRDMSPERDFPAPVPVARRYAILASPRSGSNLLGRALFDTGLAGDPLEWLHPGMIAVERERTGRGADLRMDEFLRIMERRRTSPNGVFGMKLHYSQLLNACGKQDPAEAMTRYLRRMDRLVWIRRRDRIAQGVSLALARETKIWVAEDPRFQRDADAAVDPHACVAALAAVSWHDNGWDTLLNAAGLEALEVWYEDLVARYEHEVRRVLDWLDLPDAPVPAPPIQRQGGEVNERLRREVLAYLGVR